MTGIWFKGRNLGMANGVSAMGMGLGLMLGPLVSATVLSPLLGGWRHVMFVLGAISALVGILWMLLGKEPRQAGAPAKNSNPVSFRLAIGKLVRVKALWLTGVTIMARGGSVTGMIGFLPLYLRDQGWSPASADGALTVFFAASTFCVVPLTLLSDKLGSRKAILFPAIVVTMLSIGLLPFASGAAVWILMVLAGMSMDGFMATICSMVLETEAIGPAYAGTALGLVFTIQQIGGVVSPPLGNSLESVSSGMPFIFWGSISLIAFVTLFFIKETGWRRKRITVAGIEAET